MSKKTFSQKPSEVERQWYEIDASGMPIGRLATRVATLLSGKGKPTHTPHVDGGDYVIVTNASKVVLTGRKGQEMHYRYSGYPSGITAVKKEDLLTENPQQAVTQAVTGMLPKNKLLKQRVARLKVFSESQHDHTAQQPKKLELSS